MKVTILGCGPAGLMAAHAAAERDHEVRILSRTEKSKMGGAQFLHKSIPGIGGVRPIVIDIYKVGTKEGYAEKLYADPKAPVSFDQFEAGQVEGWPLDIVYQILWDRYSGLIEERYINARNVGHFESDIIFSTIPVTSICRKFITPNQMDRHNFPHVSVLFVPRAYGLGIGDNNAILYNGTREDDWYRSSRINGNKFTEIPAIKIPNTSVGDAGGWIGTKPLDTNCDCYPNVHRLGRFGKWKKGQLTHHAYEDAVRILESAE